MIIGFTGQPFTGKTTCSGMVSHHVSKYHIKTHVFSFAGPIRAMLVAMGVPHMNLHNQIYKNEALPKFGGKSARFLLQTLGTEWGRKIVSPDIWVSMSMADADASLKSGEFVIYDDVRFPDEMEAIKKRGGIMVKLERTGCVGDSHVSNTALGEAVYDEVVYNNGSQEELKEQIDAIIERRFGATLRNRESSAKGQRADNPPVSSAVHSG